MIIYVDDGLVCSNKMVVLEPENFFVNQPDFVAKILKRYRMDTVTKSVSLSI